MWKEREREGKGKKGGSQGSGVWEAAITTTITTCHTNYYITCVYLRHTTELTTVTNTWRRNTHKRQSTSTRYNINLHSITHFTFIFFSLSYLLWLPLHFNHHPPFPSPLLSLPPRLPSLPSSLLWQLLQLPLNTPITALLFLFPPTPIILLLINIIPPAPLSLYPFVSFNHPFLLLLLSLPYPPKPFLPSSIFF